MTERLQDLFAEMLAEEPPLRVTPANVVGDGRRLHRRRRVLVRSGSALAAVLAVVAGAGVLRVAGSAGPVPPAPPVPAGAVFVAPSGHDDAAGTRSAPLASVAAAVRRAPAGGTVLLRGGTYRASAGVLDKRLTIEAYGTEPVRLAGSDVLTSWVRDGTVWRARAAAPAAGVYRDGVGLLRVGSRAAVRTGTFFADPAGAVYVGDDPAGAVLEAAVRASALRLEPGAAGSVLRGLTFSGYAGPAALSVSAAGVVVEGSHFTQNVGVGAAFSRADGVVVRGNEFSRNGSGGVRLADTAGATLNENSVVGNGRGVELSGAARATVSGNAFIGNVTQIGVYGDSTGVAVTGNAFSSGTGLLLDTGHRAPGMFAALAGNQVTALGTQQISWCLASTCARYPTVAAFAAATGLPFGTVFGTEPTSNPGHIPPGHTTPPASGGSAPPPTRQYLADPGFEATPLWWRTFGPATALTPVPTARSGAHALRVTATGPAADIAGTTGTSTTLRTVAGHRYTARCWVRADTPELTAKLQLQEYTVSWVRVAAPGASAPVRLSEPGRWYELAVTYTATRPGNQLPLSVYATSLASAGGALLVDDCSLTDA